jgi:hypothetical protein
MKSLIYGREGNIKILAIVLIVSLSALAYIFLSLPADDSLAADLTPPPSTSGLWQGAPGDLEQIEGIVIKEGAPCGDHMCMSIRSDNRDYNVVYNEYEGDYERGHLVSIMGSGSPSSFKAWSIEYYPDYPEEDET